MLEGCKPQLSKSVMIQMRIYYENKNYRIIGN